MDKYELKWHHYVLPNIHPEGIKFVLIFGIVTLLLGWAFVPLGIIGLILTLWCYYFFRNPERITPEGDDLVISPADGIVQMIGDVTPPPELDLGEKPLTRISIFMSVFNVHVNRSPVTGKVKKSIYYEGAFLNASLDKASEDNERQMIIIETSTGDKKLAFVQIAGLVARRILCNLKEGQEIKAGEIFGLIRFGSRLDVYLPEGIEPKVICGQKAVAGETILASLTGKQTKAKGRAG